MEKIQDNRTYYIESFYGAGNQTWVVEKSSREYFMRFFDELDVYKSINKPFIYINTSDRLMSYKDYNPSLSKQINYTYPVFDATNPQISQFLEFLKKIKL